MTDTKPPNLRYANNCCESCKFVKLEKYTGWDGYLAAYLRCGKFGLAVRENQICDDWQAEIIPDPSPSPSESSPSRS